MKSFLYGAAIVIGSLGLFSVYLFGVALRSSGAIETDAQRWLDQELPPLLKSWDPELLTAKAAPELIANNGLPKVREAIAAMRDRLGALREYRGSKVAGLQAPEREGGTTFVVVQLTATGEFEKGTAAFDVKVIRREAKWAYAAFSARD